MSNLNDTMFARPPVFATAADAADLHALVAMAGTTAPGAGQFREEFYRLTILPDFVGLATAVLPA